MFNFAARNRRAFSELSFGLAMALWLQWFCKIPFPDSTYFELKVLVAELLPWEPQNKNCWMLQQGTENFQSYLSNWLQCYYYNDSAKHQFQIYFEWQFWKLSVLPWRATKKNLLNVAARNREEHFQSYLLNWLRCYHYNDSAKHHFQIQLIPIERCETYLAEPGKKKTAEHRSRD